VTIASDVGRAGEAIATATAVPGTADGSGDDDETAATTSATRSSASAVREAPGTTASS
jgi:hypothetical protein